MERRSMERFPLELSAMITCTDKDHNDYLREYRTSNICAGGVYFKTEEPLPVSTDVRIALIWHPETFVADSPGEKRQIRLTGSVVRSEKQGMAISFNHNVKFMAAN